MKIHILHENPDWHPPIAAALDAAGVPHQQWLLGEGALDLADAPPAGVFWSRMSASAHARGHSLAQSQARAVLSWLESHGARVVHGRRVLELELSKVSQLAALRAAGFDVPRTIAVAGSAGLAAAARKLPAPFISKPNQGGKGIGVRLFGSHHEFDACLNADPEPSPDGITLLQEYLPAADSRITRAELVGGEFIYAITADPAAGGFALCPAEAGAAATSPGLFALRPAFAHQPVVGRYLDFARQHGIEVAGFELIETAGGRLVTCGINTTTNYSPGIEAAARRPALPAVAAFLGRLLAAQDATAGRTGAAPARGGG